MKSAHAFREMSRPPVTVTAAYGAQADLGRMSMGIGNS
ncbi:hypothetical protein STAFG_6435 [Streptomyces afghaniensis 772]|uniref:Uncharacterized protein n=1 Tax=Streptomyces afghaniensis 772 TaxID=1283301 RepID=S4MIW1_9ACTN|nr:hypothetical protein STAFG_6435 [Streptomyces afghaniensis 772]